MQHLVGFKRSHRARSPPGGQTTARGVIDFRTQNATFCVPAQRSLADPQPTQNGGYTRAGLRPARLLSVIYFRANTPALDRDLRLA